MKELISRLTSQAGLTEEQAANALSTMKEYLSEKFPMLEDMMEKMIGSEDESTSTEATSGVENESLTDKAGDMLSSVKDKASELLDSDKLEGLADNASEMADEAINKIKGLFGKK